jgi:hypothetical protein
LAWNATAPDHRTGATPRLTKGLDGFGDIALFCLIAYALGLTIPEL